MTEENEGWLERQVESWVRAASKMSEEGVR